MTFFYDLNKRLADIANTPEKKQLNERDMSRHAKGIEKYGKDGMEALAKAGRKGKNLEPIRNKYDRYNKTDANVNEVSSATMKAAQSAGTGFSGSSATSGISGITKAGTSAKPLNAGGGTDAVMEKKPRTPITREDATINELSPQLLTKARDQALAQKAAIDRKYKLPSGIYYSKDANVAATFNQARADKFEKGAAAATRRDIKRFDQEQISQLGGLSPAARRKLGMAEEYGPLEEKGGVPMTARQKKFAALAEPKNKITFADKIAGAKKEVDEMLGDVAAEAMKGALRRGQKKLDRNHNGRIDAKDLAMLRAGKGKQETDEARDEDYYGLGDTDKSHRTSSGGTVTTKGRVTRHQAAPGRYGGYNPETDPDKDDTAGDSKSAGEKRGRGRPKGSKKALGAKGPSGKSKLLTREGDNQSDEIKQAMAMLKKAGYQVTKKAQQELDEKAVSKDQAVAARIARGVQKGEVKAKPGSASAEMAKMEPKELRKFAKTDTKGLPKKVKAKEEVEETTTSGSVATSTEAPKSKGKGGVQFGKGIYDSMNRELEQMIAESMNISMNMSNSPEGGPSKSLTVTATDDDAMYLGKLLKMAGVGGGEGGCNSAEQVDENSPDWPTDEVAAHDNINGYDTDGLNGRKTTIAGDGQTTVPVTAVQIKESAAAKFGREMHDRIKNATPDQLFAMAADFAGPGYNPRHELELLQAAQAELRGQSGVAQPGTIAEQSSGHEQKKASQWLNDPRLETQVTHLQASGVFLDDPQKGIEGHVSSGYDQDYTNAKNPMYFKAFLQQVLKKVGDRYVTGKLQAGPAPAMEQEQVMAPESAHEELDEELQRMREMAGIKNEAKKPDADKDGIPDWADKKPNRAGDDEDRKVEESILAMSNLWRAYKG